MNRDTLLGHVGREREGRRSVNTPVQRASTILFDSVADYEAAQRTRLERDQLYYATYGTQTSFAFTAGMAALEGGYGAIALSSGLAAIVATLQTFLHAGDHVLVPDSVYSPARHACTVLREQGVETTYYDPEMGAGVDALVRDNTKLIYLESPGSITFEVQDVPAIVAVAKARGIPTAIDNTWGTGYLFNAFAHGIDVSIVAATKYVAGHSDVVLGAIVSSEQYYARLREGVAVLGYSASPDDCWLALRGLRTLGVRLRAHEQRALRIAQYVASRDVVDEVLYPALPGAPGHDLWKRDFTGACGLFSFVFSSDVSEARAIAFVERLKLFSIGASWGGFESLALLLRPAHRLGEGRALDKWKARAPLVRLHVGLEDPDDLTADLDAAFGQI
ncbi:MAG: cystathionine beta-lyase [Vulcanimicrobiaceae bacterium]